MESRHTSLTIQNTGGADDVFMISAPIEGGVIIGDPENSTSLTDIVTMLDPGQSGVFKFKRRIK